MFNVINYDVNTHRFVAYDIIPYLKRRYYEIKKKPIKFEEFKKFIKTESLYQFWARCQYEIILLDWPCQKHSEKWDVYQQIMMNIDTITKILMNDVCK